MQDKVHRKAGQQTARAHVCDLEREKARDIGPHKAAPSDTKSEICLMRCPWHEGVSALLRIESGLDIPPEVVQMLDPRLVVMV